MASSPRLHDLDSDNDPQQRPEGSSVAVGKLRFRCPLAHKYDAQCKGKRCSVDGWPSVHRLKYNRLSAFFMVDADLLPCREHIERRHSGPPSCPRCHAQTFKDESEVSVHLQNEVACTKVTMPPPRDPMLCTKVQIEGMKSRRKSGVTDEQEWQRIYKVLSPGEAPWNDMPSPCQCFPRDPLWTLKIAC